MCDVRANEKCLPISPRASSLRTTNINSFNEILDGYKLFQNFPNPFNPNTKITYHIPKNNFVKLEIFDIRGKLIQTLVNEPQVAGNYSIEVSGINFSSGVYYYKIKAGAFTETKKLILIK